MDIWDKIIKEAREVKLDSSEKAILLGSIISHTKSNPCVKKPNPGPYAGVVFSWTGRRFITVSAMVLILLLGSTSFAASYALPGEALYSVKLNVNEQFESMLALSPNTNARFESIKAERRLREVEKLVIRNKKITPKAKTQIKQNLSKNTENIKKIASEIEAKGDTVKADEVKTIFLDKLENQSTNLKKLSETEKDLRGDIKNPEQLDLIKSDIEEINIIITEQINKVKEVKEDDNLPKEENPIGVENVGENTNEEIKIKSQSESD